MARLRHVDGRDFLEAAIEPLELLRFRHYMKYLELQSILFWDKVVPTGVPARMPVRNY